MDYNNLEMLQIVAVGLGDLVQKVVFVGGAVLELYATKFEAIEEVRFTEDVDCVLNLGSYLDYSELEVALRSKEFSHDTSPNAPICRWVFKGIKVDIMPTEAAIIGFSNKWYNEGVHNYMEYLLPNNITIQIFQAPYFIASKIVAHNDRGGNDYRLSHDFQDIIFLLDNRKDILIEILQTQNEVKTFIQTHFRHFLAEDSLEEGIYCALPYNANREIAIMELMATIASS